MEGRAPSSDELKRLAGDPVFAKIFASDPELDRLEKQRYDEAAEILLLGNVLRLPMGIGTLAVKPLTVERWSFLWACGNSYARGGSASEKDMDVFLLVLSRDLRNLGCAPHELAKRSAGYARATTLPPEDVHREIASVIRLAFMPLEMLPYSPGEDNEPPRYDADWVIRTAGLAARESNHTLRYCAGEMSLSEVCLCFVDYKRRNEIDGCMIRRHPSRETEEAMIRRTRILQTEYLDQLKKTRN